MSNRKLAHQAAGLFFVFSIGFGLVWAADDGVRDNGQPTPESPPAIETCGDKYLQLP